MKTLHSYKMLGLLAMLGLAIPLSAQPGDLPWDPDPVCGGILTEGIVIATCGIFDNVPASQQWTLGIMDINNALPPAGRIDVTGSTPMYHHPSWIVDSIGNTYGITIDHCANFYMTSSSNYAFSFGGLNAILQYGLLGGGFNDLEAAGTIYKVDAITAQASPWAVLPQQSYSFSHYECFSGAQAGGVRNTGPGLGNITFSFETFNFYASNFEDGRIYRLDTLGNILESYDPFLLDNNNSGPPGDLNEVVYGLAMSPDNSELFFGNCAEGNSSNNAAVYSIPLNPDGSFSGTIDNSNNPVGATWNNIVGTEQFHVETTPVQGFNLTSFISDLEFTPDNKLIVGNRSGCSGSLHSNYDEGGKTEVILPDGSGLYSLNQGIIYTTSEGFSNNTDYGGVAFFDNPNGGIEYIISTGDMIDAGGPHGIIVVPEDTYGAPGIAVSPAGIISYNDNTNSIFLKGNGGDVQVFQECACEIICPDQIVATPISVCSGEPFSLEITSSNGNASLITTWTDQNNQPVPDPGNVSIIHSDCAPGTYQYFVTAECSEDQNITFTDTLEVTVVTDDILPFLTFVEEGCLIDILIESGCEAYIDILTPIPTIEIGESGSVQIDVVQNTIPSCDQLVATLNYDCQCTIEGFIVTPQECDLGSYNITLDFITDGTQQTFSVVDQNDVDYGTYNYLDLPIEIGPFTGDNLSTYTLFIEDSSQADCEASIDFGPFYCPPAIASWEANDPTCLDENGSLQFIEIIGGEAPYFYSIDGGQTFGDETFFDGLSPGTYQVVVQDAQGNILQDEEVIIPLQEITIDAGADVSLLLGESYQLNLLLNIAETQIASIQWIPAEGLSCTDCLNPIASPVETTTYTAIVTDLAGCIVETRVTIEIDPALAIYIPNVFSPNNDGINDIFRIYSREGTVASVREFKIFDRWGELVHIREEFLPEDPGAGWDGYFRGQLMNPAVFAYYAIIEFVDGSVGFFEGDVTLVR